MNGNPIEEISGYRLYVCGMMFNTYETLKKLDNVLISKNEFDSVIVWNQNKGNSLKLKKMKVPPKKYKWQEEMRLYDEQKAKKENAKGSSKK